MPLNTKALVVGTTSDYIDWIRNTCPGQALFLTDHAVRSRAQEIPPPPQEEILCDLSDYDSAIQRVRHHIEEENLCLAGIVSYDCESMELAAVMAQVYEQPYPSVQTINNCRNKYISNRLWQKHHLHTPRTRLMTSAAELGVFFKELNGACVLKPLSGSGSELVFRCDTALQGEHRFKEIQTALQHRRTNRLYQPFVDDNPAILAEEYVDGSEYSCDFIIENGRVEIVRLTSKIFSPHGPFGTVLGYLLQASIPAEIDEHELVATLYRCATALGIERGFCMLDFLVRQERLVLLEIAPRPGGDCLPFLLRQSQNLDTITLFLNFSMQRPLSLKPLSVALPFIGMPLRANQNGVIKNIDVNGLENDRRVRKVHLTRRPGHTVTMPPADYDSWLIGHVIFEADTDGDTPSQCADLLEKLVVEIE